MGNIKQERTGNPFRLFLIPPMYQGWLFSNQVKQASLRPAQKRFLLPALKHATNTVASAKFVEEKLHQSILERIPKSLPDCALPSPRESKQELPRPWKQEPSWQKANQKQSLGSVR